MLSPLLFAIFINSISDKLISSYHLYADDLQLYTHASPSDIVQAVNFMNTDLTKIVDWGKHHGLMVNPKKTQVILIGSSRLMNKKNFRMVPPIYFDGVHVPYSDTVRNLGVIFDKFMTWSPQLEAVSRRMFASGGSLRRLRNFLPTSTKIALARIITPSSLS